jgi:hypothetical protein
MKGRPELEAIHYDGVIETSVAIEDADTGEVVTRDGHVIIVGSADLPWCDCDFGNGLCEVAEAVLSENTGKFEVYREGRKLFVRFGEIDFRGVEFLVTRAEAWAFDLRRCECKGAVFEVKPRPGVPRSLSQVKRFVLGTPAPRCRSEADDLRLLTAMATSADSASRPGGAVSPAALVERLRLQGVGV